MKKEKCYAHYHDRSKTSFVCFNNHECWKPKSHKGPHICSGCGKIFMRKSIKSTAPSAFLFSVKSIMLFMPMIA